MKVTILGSIDPRLTRPGGIRSYTMHLIHNLVEKGVECRLIGADYQVEGDFPKQYSFSPIVKVEGKFTSQMWLRTLNKYCKKNHFNTDTIVHTQRPDDLYPVLKNNSSDLRTICTIHGNTLHGIKSRKSFVTSKIYSHLESYVLKRVDRVLMVDKRNMSEYVKHYPFIEGKTHNVPIGIDIGKFQRQDRKEARKKMELDGYDRICLFVGRFSQEKRIPSIIKAFNNSKYGNNDVLVIVGDGPDKNEILKLVNENDNIIVKGTVEHDLMPLMYNCADVLTLFSEYEGLPTVVLESMAAGVPVISTPVGAVPELVMNSHTGRIVKNEKELIEAMNMIWEGRSIGKKEYCREKSEEYSWDKVVDRVIEQYEQL